ncbi:MAG: hypothetical protein U0Q07_03490 [Acidimicrobiales bacterium]
MTAVEPHAPVLVGAAQVTRRPDEPAVDAAALMATAARRAADDAAPRSASAEALLAAVGEVWVPEGTWGHRDAGRLVAEAVGAAGATTHRVDVGVTQQALLAGAAVAIAEGRADVVLVAGGEARLHARAAAAGEVGPEAVQAADVAPDHVHVTADLGIDDLEIVRDIVTPAVSYALVDHLLGHRSGRTPAEHRARLGALWARFAAVASANPWAWDRSGPSAEEILAVGPGNRPIADPYPKRLCSQWNVDQAAALLLCSAAAAERFGVDHDRRVFPHVSVVADHAVPLVARDDLAACPGAEVAGPLALELAGVGLDDLGPLDLYSCFPAAVEVYAAALGLPLDDPARPLTATGGMAFAGGPLNSYVLHALVAMVPALRDDPARPGLSTSVSGMLTKQGFGVWAAHPPSDGLRVADVTGEVAARTTVRRVAPTMAGAVTVASWTVTYDGTTPARLVVVAEDDDGTRTIAEARDPEVVGAVAGDVVDLVGRRVAVDDGVLAPLT